MLICFYQFYLNLFSCLSVHYTGGDLDRRPSASVMGLSNCSEVGDRAVREVIELSKGHRILTILITFTQLLPSIFSHISNILE